MRVCGRLSWACMGAHAQQAQSNKCIRMHKPTWSTIGATCRHTGEGHARCIVCDRTHAQPTRCACPAAGHAALRTCTGTPTWNLGAPTRAQCSQAALAWAGGSLVLTSCMLSCVGCRAPLLPAAPDVVAATAPRLQQGGACCAVAPRTRPALRTEACVACEACLAGAPRPL